MEKSILAAIARNETVTDKAQDMQGLTISGAHEALEKAEKAYDEWNDSITDYTAHEKAFDVVRALAAVTQESAYLDGLKAGIRIVIEAFM